MNKLLLITPIISAFLGWLANWLLIKILFYPRHPIKILGITFQGILPKRQNQFAQQLGKIIATEFSIKEIGSKATHPDNLKKIMPFVDEHIDNFLKNKLSETIPMLSMFISNKTITQLKGVFMTELEQLFPQLMNKYFDNLETELNIEKMVSDKVSAFSIDKVEQVIITNLGKELRYFTIVGSMVGLIIGLLPVIIIKFLS